MTLQRSITVILFALLCLPPAHASESLCDSFMRSALGTQLVPRGNSPMVTSRPFIEAAALRRIPIYIDRAGHPNIPASANARRVVDPSRNDEEDVYIPIGNLLEKDHDEVFKPLGMSPADLKAIRGLAGQITFKLHLKSQRVEYVQVLWPFEGQPQGASLEFGHAPAPIEAIGDAGTCYPTRVEKVRRVGRSTWVNDGTPYDLYKCLPYESLFANRVVRIGNSIRPIPECAKAADLVMIASSEIRRACEGAIANFSQHDWSKVRPKYAYPDSDDIRVGNAVKTWQEKCSVKPASAIAEASAISETNAIISASALVALGLDRPALVRTSETTRTSDSPFSAKGE